MSERPPVEETTRAGDRRQNDRRRLDRRTPAPPWRRPWAFVAYGVVGALLVVLAFGSDDEEAGAVTGGLTTASAPPAVDPRTPAAADAPLLDAYTVGEFERLLAQGEAAIGQRVRTELYCGPVAPVALRDVGTVTESVAALADANRRVPAAECRWGDTPSAPDFLLLVPAELTVPFAAAPEVTQDFVRRRRVRAELEWIGRSEALALRNAGVLRAVSATP